MKKAKISKSKKTITLTVAFKKPQSKSYPMAKVKKEMAKEEVHTKNKKARQLIVEQHMDEMKKKRKKK